MVPAGLWCLFERMSRKSVVQRERSVRVEEDSSLAALRNSGENETERPDTCVGVELEVGLQFQKV